MNIRVTNAAEGLPRYGFTVADVERMVAAGILPEDARVELIEGQLVPMSPKGIRHEIFVSAFMRHWSRALPQHVVPFQEVTFRLSEQGYLEPDVLLLPRANALRRLVPTSVLLAVEIADTSLAYDLGRKPAIYAAYGVRELWVVDANALVTHVHRDPAGEAYTVITTHAADALLKPSLLPEGALRLADLDLLDLRDS